jgi:hypothetical protein
MNKFIKKRKEGYMVKPKETISNLVSKKPIVVDFKDDKSSVYYHKNTDEKINLGEESKINFYDKDHKHEPTENADEESYVERNSISNDLQGYDIKVNLHQSNQSKEFLNEEPIIKRFLTQRKELSPAHCFIRGISQNTTFMTNRINSLAPSKDINLDQYFLSKDSDQINKMWAPPKFNSDKKFAFID